MTLTERRISRIKAPAKNPKKYGYGHGLYLQVTKNGARSWIFRYQRAGKDSAMGLGPLRLVSQKQARQLALDAERLVDEGRDPIAARKQRRSAAALTDARKITFREASEQFLTAHAAEWHSAKFRALVASSLQMYAYPILGKLSCADVDRALVLRVVEPIWRTKTETASRLRGRIEGILDWATVHGYRTGDNPARWSGNLEISLSAPSKIAKVQHHAALPYADIGAFMVELPGRAGIAARALEFLILTAARTGEVIGATWDEFDLAAKTWTIPAERMKAEREHKVPLCERAIKLLDALPRDGTFVFPLSNMAMSILLRKRMGRNVTVHGFRSTFRDWAAEMTTVQNFVVEMALAHAVGSAVEAAYRRGDLFEKRRKLMNDWGRYCSAPRADTATVIPIGKARKMKERESK
jgi:integrase